MKKFAQLSQYVHLKRTKFQREFLQGDDDCMELGFFQGYRIIMKARPRNRILSTVRTVIFDVLTIDDIE